MAAVAEAMGAAFRGCLDLPRPHRERSASVDRRGVCCGMRRRRWRGWRQVTLPACGGFAEIARQSAEAKARMSLAPTQAAVARPSPTASISMRRRPKSGSTSRSRRCCERCRRPRAGTLSKPRAPASAASSSRRLLHCSSSVQADFRPRAGARPDGEWLSSDWVEIEFSAKEFGAAAAAYGGGHCSRSRHRREHVSGALHQRYPAGGDSSCARGGILPCLVRPFDPKVAEAYLGAAAPPPASALPVQEGDHTKGAGGSEGKRDEEELFAERPASNRQIPVAEPYAEFVAGLDRGDATRSADDANRVRQQRWKHDALAECIEKGVGRCEAVDEYGRSPLFLAAFGGHINAVDVLLANGRLGGAGSSVGWIPRCCCAEPRCRRAKAGSASLGPSPQPRGSCCIHASKRIQLKYVGRHPHDNPDPADARSPRGWLRRH